MVWGWGGFGGSYRGVGCVQSSGSGRSGDIELDDYDDEEQGN